MYNPRFPHTLVIKRAQKDRSGMPVFDEMGNVSYNAVSVLMPVIVGGEPLKDEDGSLVVDSVTEIPFGYRGSNRGASTTPDVLVISHQIACPMFIGEIQANDVLEITDSDRSYIGKVVRKETNNLGTNIWFDEVRN